MRGNRLNGGYLYRRRVIIFFLRLIDWVLNFLVSRNKAVPQFPERILLVKPDHLGDFLLFSSILPHLKKKFPKTQFDLLTGPWNESMAKEMRFFNKILIARHPMHDRSNKSFLSKLLIYTKEMMKIGPQIRKNDYHIVLFFRAFGGNLIPSLRFFTSACFIGHKSGGFGAFLDHQVSWEEGVHETEHFLEVLTPFDLEIKKEDLRYYYHPPQRQPQYFDIQSFPGRRIALHPGSGDPSKVLPASKWLEILQREKFDWIFLVGLEAESKFETPLKEAGLPVINCTNKFTIKELQYIFHHCQKIFCLDSLAGHLAGTTETPSHVFFQLDSDPTQWHPLGNNIRIIDYVDPLLAKS